MIEGLVKISGSIFVGGLGLLFIVFSFILLSIILDEIKRRL